MNRKPSASVTPRIRCLVAGLMLASLTPIGFAAQSFSVLFDFTRSTGDRDWYLGERQPANTFDNNTSALAFQVVSSPELSLSVNTLTAPRLLLNDPNPDVLDSSIPASAGDLVAVTNVVVRTRLSQLTSSTSGESASVGFVFGVTGTGSSQSGYIARLERTPGAASPGKLYIDALVSGVRGANLVTSAAFAYSAQSTVWFLDLRITSDGVSTNVVLNAFLDAQIPGTGNDTNRLLDAAFNTATPTKSVTASLTGYTAGFLGVYFEDNSGGAGSNPTAGLARLYNFYAKSDVPVKPLISLAATTPVAAEGGATGAFTLTRSANTSGALTVNYTVGGTATSGDDYTALSGTATFADGQTSVEIPVTAPSDAVAEPTETVVVTVNASDDYAISGGGSTVVSIADANTPEFAVVVTDTNAYERVAQLSAAFTVSRPAGSTNTTVTVNFTLGGAAVLGVDYLPSATNALAFAPGVSSQVVTIAPINNAILDGNRAVTLTLENGAGYTLSATYVATATIFDDELPAETVWFSDTFETADSATNYFTIEGAGDGVPDSSIDYSFDYSSVGVPAAPGSATTRGLKVTANKSGANKSAVVNLFPSGVIASNNFALRFHFYIQWDPAANFSEHALAGINHSGSVTNWRNQSPPAGIFGDGQFVGLSNNDGDNPGIVTLYGADNLGVAPVGRDNRTRVALAPLLNNPPYGANGNATNGILSCGSTSTNKTWADCELSQVDGVVRFKINATTVMAYTNTSGFTNGHVMLGYMDDFDSLGPASNFALFDNVRLVALPVNQPPAASAISMGAQSGVPATLRIIGGKHAPSDPDGDSLTVSAVGYTSGNGATVTNLDGTNLVYTAAGDFTGTDSFSYTVSDGRGGNATATVTVTVSGGNNGQGFNQMGLDVLGGGAVRVTFLGIPGLNYALDWRTNLSLGDWVPVLTNAAATNGFLIFTNTSAAPENYFRTRHVP